MCRSIQTLRRPGAPATEGEIHAASLQYVRKISGYRKPSRVNEAAFDAAVADVAAATERLLAALRAPRPSAASVPAARSREAPAGTG
jgi:hypothetical protein